MPPRASSRPSATRARPKRHRCAREDCRRLAVPRGKYCEEDRPKRAAPRTRKFCGRTEPRLFTKPLRPLNRKTSRGFEVIDFAEMIGEPLHPWQQWAVIHALELLPDGSYRFRTVLILVARQNGKSHLKRIVTLWRMYMDGARRIVGAAQDLSLARDQWQMCQETIHACPDLEEEWAGVRNVNGDEMFWAGGCRYAIKATNDKAGRGGSNDEVNIDELRAQKDWKAWASLSKTTMARASGQLWAMSNAGDDESVVLNQLRDVAVAGTDPTLGIFEWSAKDGCELDDWAQIAQANPGLGTLISESAIRSALATDPPNIFRTEVLCQKVDQLDGAIDLSAWRACADPAGNMNDPELRKRLSVCLDIAPDGKHATLVAAAMLPDGRVRVEVIKAWPHSEGVRQEADELMARIKPAAYSWYPSGPAAALAPIMRAQALKWNRIRGGRKPGQLPEDGGITGPMVTEACQGLADLTTARQIVHSEDPLLDSHVRGAKKLRSGDGWRFTRFGDGHVDAAYAAAGAVLVALTMPPAKRARIHMIG